MVEATQKMRKGQGTDAIKKVAYRILYGLMLTTFPIYVLVYIIYYIEILETVGNAILNLFGIFVTGGCIFYTYKLGLLVKTMSSEASKQLVFRLRRYSFFLTLACVIEVAGTVGLTLHPYCDKTLQNMKDPGYYLLTLVLIHTGEMVPLTLFAVALFGGGKKKKKTGGTKTGVECSSGNTTMKSSAAAGSSSAVSSTEEEDSLPASQVTPLKDHSGEKGGTDIE